jgi:peptidoglycan/xylan/chitin deacetylase (PgdA/CDA1 family)/SAM-dependent methyltransferase
VTLGIVVAAGSSIPTANTLCSIARLSPPADQVVVTLPPGIDARVKAWLTATCARRGWTCVSSPAGTLGAAINAGLATLTSDWVLVVEGGDTVPSRIRNALHQVSVADADTAMLAGVVTTTAIGVDGRAAIDTSCPVGLDPSHPALRGVLWGRAAIAAAGGLDDALPAGARYELWLRLLSRGAGVSATDDVTMHVSVGDDSPLRAELSTPEWSETVARITSRHIGVLAAVHRQVLEMRARRVTALRRDHLAALRRHREAEHRLRDLEEFSEASPAAGWRASPLSRDWGYERGGPVDRHYIEQVLAANAADIRGAVLEVQEADYTTRFGGDSVTRSEIVDLWSGNDAATIVTDLRCAANVADETFDCVILTQTVHVIDPMSAVIDECHRILRPGGVLLLTAPAVSRVCLEYGRDGDFWRMTPDGVRRLLAPAFGSEVTVTTYGNAGAGAAFLLGAGRTELPDHVLTVTDPFNPTLVGARAVKAGGVTPGPAMRTRHAKEGMVLLYHRVGGSDPDPHRLNVSSDAFAAQMEWLAQTCAVIPLTDLVEGARRGSLPPRAVAVTFDDGYLDTLSVAAPILERFNLPATCFATTAGLDGPHVFWWDQLASALLSSDDVPATIDLTLPDGPFSMATTSRGLRLLAHNRIYHSLVHAGIDERERVMDEIVGWSHGALPSAACRRMTADELRQLSNAGVEVGAHTVRHLQLPALSRPEQVTEIADSRHVLERVLGRQVTALAYPFGAFDESSVAAARDAGVTCAFTCERRALDGSADPLALPRVDPQTARMDHFAAAVDHTLRAR